jgi:hypothetical protein
MGASTTAGAKVYIGTTATDPLTDTYTEIKEVTSIGAFGRTYSEVTHTPLATRGVQKFKGSYNDGSLELEMADDSSDPGQALVQAALDDDFDHNIKVEANDDVAPASATVTMTIAAPGVITDTLHGLAAGTPLKLSTTGALPTGLTAGTTYYVKTVIDPNSYSLAATVGGSAIATTGTQSGVHTRTTVPSPTLKYLKAKVMAFPSAAMNSDSIMARTCTLGIKSGSTTTVARVPAS